MIRRLNITCDFASFVHHYVYTMFTWNLKLTCLFSIFFFHTNDKRRYINVLFLAYAFSKTCTLSSKRQTPNNAPSPPILTPLTAPPHTHLYTFHPFYFALLLRTFLILSYFFEEFEDILNYTVHFIQILEKYKPVHVVLAICENKSWKRHSGY